jgi:hypothetical protein
MARGFWSRPELRLFYTYARWNDAAALAANNSGEYRRRLDRRERHLRRRQPGFDDRPAIRGLVVSGRLPVRPEHHHRQRRQVISIEYGCDCQRMSAGWQRAVVTHVAAVVPGSVAVQHFAVGRQSRHAEAIALAHEWREVGDDEQTVIAIPGTPDVREDAVFPVLASIHSKPWPLAILFMERRFADIESVQVGHPVLQAAMRFARRAARRLAR